MGVLHRLARDSCAAQPGGQPARPCVAPPLQTCCPVSRRLGTTHWVIRAVMLIRCIISAARVVGRIDAIVLHHRAREAQRQIDSEPRKPCPFSVPAAVHDPLESGPRRIPRVHLPAASDRPARSKFDFPFVTGSLR